VAGTFYPCNAGELASAVDEYCSGARDPADVSSDSATSPPRAKIAAHACLVPHAGYIYAGHVAGAVYGAIEIPTRIILLGPRHYSVGEAMAILSSGKWLTPLGEAVIDAPLAEELKHACPSLREDEVAHRREHSLEVQLPFLQRACPDFTFVPVVLGTDEWDSLEALGHALTSVINAHREPVLLIASSDMNHYQPDDVTRVKDNLAVECLLVLDARGLYDTVRREGITMCGYAPAVCMLIAARELGARHAELLRYATSGDVNDNRNEVVGYAGMIFHA
jgi:hypothetical protein